MSPVLSRTHSTFWFWNTMKVNGLEWMWSYHLVMNWGIFYIFQFLSPSKLAVPLASKILLVNLFMNFFTFSQTNVNCGHPESLTALPIYCETSDKNASTCLSYVEFLYMGSDINSKKSPCIIGGSLSRIDKIRIFTNWKINRIKFNFQIL